MGGGALSVNTVVPGTGLQLGAGVGDYDEFAAYAAALSPDRIAAHWTRGGSHSANLCPTTPTAPYSQAVLARSEERRVGKDCRGRERRAYEARQTERSTQQAI